MEIDRLYQMFRECNGISTDSRNIIPNSIFVALKGTFFDGNAYANEALEKGATCAVIDNPKIKGDDRHILVTDVLSTLQSLALFHLKTLKPALKVIGLTGSNGKTTTKELIINILSTKYHVGYTKGNLNNHIGVPLTVLDLNENNDLAVIEMGANHIGEIKKLCEIAMPDVGLITNIGKAHLEGFGSIEGIIKGKLELFRYIDNTNGICFINANSPELMENTGFVSCEKIYYGNHNQTSVYGTGNTADSPFVHMEIHDGSNKINVDTNLIGHYNHDNVVAAAAIGKYFDIPWKKMKTAIEQYLPQNNRSQYITKGSNSIILDAYNANPTSMEASVLNFFRNEGANKTVILGEMKELGNYSYEAHKKIVDLLTGNNIHIILVGQGFKPFSEYPDISFFNSTQSLIEYLKQHPINNTSILIKGSRANQLEKLLEFL